jgi:hypothetical protein
MAVYWSGTTMSPLFSEPTLELGRSGEARAVNNSGEFVGSRKLLNSVGQYIPKAFRGKTNGAVVAADDYLIPPSQPNLTSVDVPCEALAVTERVGAQSGIAVGWAGSRVGNAFLQRPVVWWERPYGQPQPTNARWLDIADGSPQSTGQANAINGYGMIYGWVRLSSTGNQRAAIWDRGWKKHNFIDDKIAIYGLTDSWDLEEFVDATDKELILGNGKKGGSSRAFLLVPQPVSN